MWHHFIEELLWAYLSLNREKKRKLLEEKIKEEKIRIRIKDLCKNTLRIKVDNANMRLISIIGDRSMFQSTSEKK